MELNREQIEKRIAVLKQIQEQIIANLNGNIGAIKELENLLNSEKIEEIK